MGGFKIAKMKGLGTYAMIRIPTPPRTRERPNPGVRYHGLQGISSQEAFEHNKARNEHMNATRHKRGN